MPATLSHMRASCPFSYLALGRAAPPQLMEDDFLGGLKRYDRDHVDPAVVKKLQAYVANPDFMPEKIQQVENGALPARNVDVLAVGPAEFELVSLVCRSGLLVDSLCQLAFSPRGSFHVRAVCRNPSSAHTAMLYAHSQASQAAYGLCCWVRAIESYDR